MKVIKCINGHYFDGDTYLQCPHCGAVAGNGNETNTSMPNTYYGNTAAGTTSIGNTSIGITVPEVKEKKSIFGRKKKESSPYPQVSTRKEYMTVNGQVTVNNMMPQNISPVVPSQSVMQKPQPSANIYNPMYRQGDDNPTVQIWDSNSLGGSQSQSINQQISPKELQQQVQQPIMQQQVAPQQVQQPVVQQRVASQQVQQPIIQQQAVQQQVMQQQAVQQQAQQSVIQQAMQTPVMKPATGCVAMTQSIKPRTVDDVRTVAFYNTETEPVTGWLVCIKGECYGESFPIKAGRNNIGRGTDMDIAIVGEVSISREKQAIIIFEPNNQKFIIQPGESNSLTYVNDNLLLNSNELMPYDILQMGNAKFMFVPFCGERFNWKDYSNEK